MQGKDEGQKDYRRQLIRIQTGRNQGADLLTDKRIK